MELENEQEEFENIMKEALFKFAITSLNKYIKLKPKNDFVFSPYNIYEGLLSFYLISSGDIENCLKQILHLGNVSKYDLINNINFNKYKTYRNPDYETLNRCVIINSKSSVNLSPMNKIFNSEFVSLSSNNIDNTDKIINKDIQRLTENHIRNPVKLRATNKNMNIVLMSTHYFYGRRLETSSTCQSSRVSTIPAQLMCTTVFNQEFGMNVSEFPINDGCTSLYMLSPSLSESYTNGRLDYGSTISLWELIERLSTDEGLCKLREILKYDRSSHAMRYSSELIFEMEKNFNMNDLLRALDAKQLFMPDAIRVDHLFTRDDESVHFGNVVHRAHIKVTKENVNAAAITLITGQKPSSSNTITDVNNDMPFVWLIYDKLHEDILFVGVFNEHNEINSEIW